MKLSLLNEEISSSDRIHISVTPVTLKAEKYEQTISFKPNGFWYGFGMDWINWCKDNSRRPGNYIYKVELTRPVKRLSSYEDIVMFTNVYGYDRHLKRLSPTFMDIDWEKFAKNGLEKGIEVTNFDQEASEAYTWIHTWDVASGCVWDTNILRLTLLTDKGPDGLR